MAAQRQNRAVAAAGNFERAGSVARMIRGDEMLAPVLDPLHCAADNSCCERYQKIFGIEFAAHSETAANIVFDHADGIVRDAQLSSQNTAIGKRHLGSAEHGQPSSVPVRHEATRL